MCGDVSILSFEFSTEFPKTFLFYSFSPVHRFLPEFDFCHVFLFPFSAFLLFILSGWRSIFISRDRWCRGHDADRAADYHSWTATNRQQHPALHGRTKRSGIWCQHWKPATHPTKFQHLPDLSLPWKHHGLCNSSTRSASSHGWMVLPDEEGGGYGCNHHTRWDLRKSSLFTPKIWRYSILFLFWPKAMKTHTHTHTHTHTQCDLHLI